jgi:acyl-coenzyme A thioesterase PaaI-like protein
MTDDAPLFTGEPEQRQRLQSRWLQTDDVGAHQAELRRMAGQMRDVIDLMVASQAPTDLLTIAADRMGDLIAEMAKWPSGRTYQGFAESATAGGDPNATFDHSPILGLANPLSPPLRVEIEGDRVVAHVHFGAAYEGPPGCVHGGYVAAVFDELLGATQTLSGTAGMTARLIVNYRRPTPLRTDLVMEGRLVRVDGRKVFVEATCSAGGEVTAEAEGLFVTIDPTVLSALRDARDAKPTHPGRS